ncbi:MAG: hypothetical protein AAF847_13030 [Bacteroidota bacterium]
MQILRELVHIVNKNKVRSIEVIGNAKENKSMIMDFYNCIAEERLTSDEAAAQHFYGTSADNHNYKKLKNRLKNRLINTVFFIDVKQPSYNQRQKAYYECYKDWAAVKILTGKHARLSAVNISHKILKQAKKYEFSELVLDIARFLRLHYGTREGNLKKYEFYNDLFNEYEQIWSKENLAEHLYVELVTRYVNSKATQGEIHDRAKEAFAKIANALDEYDSYRLQFCAYLIKNLIHVSVNDYENTVKVCNEAIELFKQKEYVASVPIQIFLHQQLISFTQLRQFDLGKAVAEECIALLEEGSFNWFKHQELYLTLSMHTGQYQQAYRIFSDAVKHRRFQFLHPHLQEMWKIYEGFLHYLVVVDRVVPQENDKKFKRFRAGKFFNETPIYSKDKRGMNIPILVIQILFMISQKKYDQAIDRIEAIEKYCSRYLRNDDTFRSNCFIKMLLQIPISGFHKAAVVRKSEKYLEKLKSKSIDIANQASEIEIIPYEDLWELALESLNHQFHRTRKKKAFV